MKNIKKISRLVLLLFLLLLTANCNSQKSGTGDNGNDPVTPIITDAAVNISMDDTGGNESSSYYLNENKQDSYLEAVLAYREFLLNQRLVVGEGQDEHTGRVYRYIHYNYSGTFTIIDADGDGIPELHINAQDYYIFKYENGELHYFLEQGSNVRSVTVLLNNLSLFTITTGAHGDIYYIYRELRTGGTLLQLSQRASPAEGCRINNNIVSEGEYLEAKDMLFRIVDTAKSDMISWTDYREWYDEHKDEYIPIQDTETYDNALTPG